MCYCEWVRCIRATSQLVWFYPYSAAGSPSFNILDTNIQCNEFKDVTGVETDVQLHVMCLELTKN